MSCIVTAVVFIHFFISNLLAISSCLLHSCLRPLPSSLVAAVAFDVAVATHSLPPLLLLQQRVCYLFFVWNFYDFFVWVVWIRSDHLGSVCHFAASVGNDTSSYGFMELLH